MPRIPLTPAETDEIAEKFRERVADGKKFAPEFVGRILAGEYCHSGRDGDCFHADCPQLRDDEPKATGRHCPLDWRSADDDYFGC